MDPELLTVSEAAEFLRTTPAAIRKAVERHQIPGAVKVGKRILLRRDDLRRHVGLVDQTLPSSPPPKAA